MCERKSKLIFFEFNSYLELLFKLDRLTKLIDTVQKEINSRYPYVDTSPSKSSK
jgi:hypothetical protein